MMAGLSDQDATELAMLNRVLRRLRAALDRDTMLDEFERSRVHQIFDAVSIIDFSVDRVHFGSRLGFVVDYTLKVLTGQGTARLKAFGQVPFGDPLAEFDAAKSKIAARIMAAQAEGAPRIALLSGVGVIIRAEGADERITFLPGLVSSSSGPEDNSLSPNALPGHHWTKAELLSHRLGKRAVLRLSRTAAHAGTSATAILKLYKRKSSAAGHSSAVSTAISRQGLGSSGAVGIPRVIGVLSDAPGLLMEEAPGRPLHLTSGGARVNGHRAAGVALARLHACRISGLEPHDIDDELRTLGRWIAFASSVRPELAASLAPKLARLSKDRTRLDPYVAVPIHRDFHDKQVIVAEGRANLIDFDTVRAGDPAQDLGNFLAHFHLYGGDRPIRPKETSEWLAFLDGYRSEASSPSEFNIDWHRRASLMRLGFICSFSDSLCRLVGDLTDEI